METVDTRVVDIALERVPGTSFENFVQGFFAATIGPEYVPLGGTHDGGADGFEDPGLFEATTPTRFMQASVTSDTVGKIRRTVRRLREFGRDPRSLLYATSQRVPVIDKLENDLSEELNVRLTIRDGAYFSAHINDSPGTKQAFSSHLAPTVSFLKEIGSSRLVDELSNLPARTLCVFIGQELDRRRGKTELLEAVTDSLILWSLEGTDPDKGIFLSQKQIEERVIETLPAAKKFFRGVLSHRLEALCAKMGNARQINFHRKHQGYCLPFETRKLIREENVEDETLRLRVSDIFRQRASKLLIGDTDNLPHTEQVVEVCHRAIHQTFHAQGLEMAMFMEQDSENRRDAEVPAMQDHVHRAMEKLNIAPKTASLICGTALSVLRGAFYESTGEERQYFRKLCRTYILLFMLKNEPRIVEYFRGMTSNFNLYIGSDLIVRCLSEHLLSAEDQMTKNALKIMRASGSTLILTDRALDEVWHHLRGTNLEYRNNYQDIHNYIAPNLVSQIGKILIRAFFYARFSDLESGRRPMDWVRYLGSFVTVSDLGNDRSRDELRAYLVNEFGFQFEDDREMLSALEVSEIDSLGDAIYSARGKVGREEESERILSRNAAATVLRVYQRRTSSNERAGDNPFGYKTWWLTQQSRLQGATGSLVAQKRARYMMRPEFILHFLANIPSAAQVQFSYDQVFPSILGIRLGSRMDERAFKEIIGKALEVFDHMDESRARVVLSTASEQLQSDFAKRYEDSEFFRPVG
jgi:hypothetical protein